MFAAVAEGTSEIHYPGTGQDNLSTLSAMGQLGVEATFDTPEHFTVVGRGPGALRAPSSPIDCGNSGTTARLLSGLLSGAQVLATLTGDESLSGRPMGRVAEPLRDIGYKVSTSDSGTLPLTIEDSRPTDTEGVRAVLRVASAQVKSCILLSGLYRDHTTEVVEPAVSRDHTERLLRAMGARVSSSRHYMNPAKHAGDPEAPMVRLYPGSTLRGRVLEVPGDPSSAAFLLASGAINGNGVAVEAMAINPTRVRFLDVLERMGASFSIRARRALTSGEPSATVTVTRSALQTTEIRGFEVPLVIDEIPVLAVVGAAATGRFVVRDAKELRVKESDRIATTIGLLNALGVTVEEHEDGFEFEGLGSACWEGFEFDCGDDHRIAMAAIVAALAASDPSSLLGTECVAVSFPEFGETVEKLGGSFK
ncbi:MAG: 3-phosphoshikimate 1-carboxyvinyltransferase [Bradymonadia bacterium]|jgi:3-phosphoshikimate 1-carboxyvinyltransferase